MGAVGARLLRQEDSNGVKQAVASQEDQGEASRVNRSSACRLPVAAAHPHKGNRKQHPVLVAVVAVAVAFLNRTLRAGVAVAAGGWLAA